MANKNDLFKDVYEPIKEDYDSYVYEYADGEYQYSEKRYEKGIVKRVKYARSLTDKIIKELKQSGIREKLPRPAILGFKLPASFIPQSALIDHYLQNKGSYESEKILCKAVSGENFSPYQFYQDKFNDKLDREFQLRYEEVFDYRSSMFEHSTNKNRDAFDKLNGELKKLKSIQHNRDLNLDNDASNYVSDSIRLNYIKFDLHFDNNENDKPHLNDLAKRNEAMLDDEKNALKASFLKKVNDIAFLGQQSNTAPNPDYTAAFKSVHLENLNAVGIDVSDTEFQMALNPVSYDGITPELQFKALLKSAVDHTRVPWEQNIPASKAAAPFNYENGGSLSGLNLIAASLHMAYIGSEDPRYLPENKIHNAGLKLADNAAPLKLAYKTIAKDGSYKMSAVNFYNAKDLRGLPKFQAPKNINEFSQPITPERSAEPDKQISNNMAGFIAALASNKAFQPVTRVKEADYEHLTALPVNDLLSKINTASSKAAQLSQSPKELRNDLGRQAAGMEM
jgi:hypothetical protein